MATKNNPGDYDCYAKLDPDEEYFLLRGKDPSAPYLTRIWVYLRNGNLSAAMYSLLEAHEDQHVQERVSIEFHQKLREAMEVSARMDNWHFHNVLEKTDTAQD